MLKEVWFLESNKYVIPFKKLFWDRLTANSVCRKTLGFWSFYFCLLSVGIIGVRHHTWFRCATHQVKGVVHAGEALHQPRSQPLFLMCSMTNILSIKNGILLQKHYCHRDFCTVLIFRFSGPGAQTWASTVPLSYTQPEILCLKQISPTRYRIRT